MVSTTYTDYAQTAMLYQWTYFWDMTGDTFTNTGGV